MTRAPAGRLTISIGLKVTVAVALAVLLGLIAQILVLTEQQKDNLTSVAEKANRDVGELLVKQLGAAAKFKQKKAISSVFEAMAEEEASTLANVVVLGPDGTQLIEFHAEQFDPFAFDSLLASLEETTAGEPKNTEFRDGQHQALVAPILFGPKNAHVGTLGMAWSKAPLNQRVAEASRIGFMIAGSTLLVLLIMITLLLRYVILRPLGTMTTVMSHLAGGEHDITIPCTKRNDEIGAMAAALEVFKSNALAAAKMKTEQAEMTAKAEAEAAERQREREESLGGEVVALVQKVIDGELSHRLSLADKSGIFAEICSQINQLVDGIGAIVSDVGSGVRALASGDLNGRITADYRGAFGALKDDVNLMSDRLTGTVTEIRTAAIEVDNAAAEIRSGTEDLSNRTEQVAAGLEETAAATEEMAATVKTNAEHAKNANQIAEAANTTAAKGSVVVEKAVDAMNGIEGSADRITDIIGVIDEIAFQTNLLALNASVEAARAGEAGKGFAVVAQEVRQLAQRAAEAASSIKGLIQDSNNKVKAGAGLVDQTGRVLTEILTSIGEVVTIVGNISAASQEQSSGVQEINGSIASMDAMTQQNSALVEESTASACTLSDQANKLKELVGFFKLAEDPKVDSTLPYQSLRPRKNRRQAENRAEMAVSTDAGWDEF